MCKYELILGKITCANVLSDIYSIGVTEIDKVTMISSIPEKMNENEVKVVMTLITKGFQVHN